MVHDVGQALPAVTLASGEKVELRKDLSDSRPEPENRPRRAIAAATGRDGQPSPAIGSSARTRGYTGGDHSD
jgi:hypothetical protein